MIVALPRRIKPGRCRCRPTGTLTVMDTLTLTRPDDWHLHLRDGPVLEHVVPWSAERFGRAIVMPNLIPPVVTTEQARAYRDRILAATPADSGFQPLMTLYLTDNTTPAEIERAAACGWVHAVKLYPAGATTNSDSGVTDIARCADALDAMAEQGLGLCIHGEVTRPETDIFDREKLFLHERLAPLLERHPRLRVVLEHLTTADAVDFVRQGPERLGATITPQHLLLNRNALLAGGIRPHHYCLPILKRERDREALVEAAVSGHPRFFLGTDSAPHAGGPRKAPVAVPVSSAHRWPSSCMRRFSMRPAHWTAWRGSRPSTVPTSTDCPATPTPSPWSGRHDPFPTSCPTPRKPSFPCAPAGPWPGA